MAAGKLQVLFGGFPLLTNVRNRTILLQVRFRTKHPKTEKELYEHPIIRAFHLS